MLQSAHVTVRKLNVLTVRDVAGRECTEMELIADSDTAGSSFQL